MTPAAALAELRRRGGHVEVLADGALRVSPRAALDDQLRAVLGAHKGEVAALVTADPPDPTPTPAPCPRCSGVVFWRWTGTTDLHCAGCIPCTDPSARVVWYFATGLDDPLAELFDPATRAACAWIARRRPAAVAELLTLERAAERLTDASDRDAYHAAVVALVACVRRMRDEYEARHA